MIPGAIITFALDALKFVGRNWKWFGLAALLMLVKCEHDGKLHWKAKAAQREAELKTFADRVDAATAKFRAAGLERLVHVQQAQIDTLQKDRDDALSLAAQRLAEFNRVRQNTADASGGRLEPVSAIPEAAGGFVADSAHPGFYSILASDAITLMQNCQGWADAYDSLAHAWDHQAAITVDLPPAKPISPNP